MKPKDIKVGTTYFGVDTERKHVLAIESGKVIFRYPVSMRLATVPLAEFAEWAKESYKTREERIAARAALDADDGSEA